MASRVKELLDELATTLAEMGMLEEQEPETAMEGDEPVTEGERSAVAASEARQARYDELLAKAERIKSAIADRAAIESEIDDGPDGDGDLPLPPPWPAP